MSNFWPAKEVLPQLWIGSKKDSQSFTFLKKNNIALVVNCTRDLPTTMPESMGIACVRVPVHDHPSEAPRFAAYAPAACRKMLKTLKGGGSVLVHCFAGVSRSASLVAVFLMGTFPSMFPNVNSAISFLQTCKPETFRDADGSDMRNFEKALVRFQRGKRGAAAAAGGQDA